MDNTAVSDRARNALRVASPENDESLELAIREIARQEIASLCGLVLRRAQDAQKGRPVGASVVVDAFAEALRDFGGTPNELGNA